MNTSVHNYDIFHCNGFKCTNIKHEHEIQSLYTNIVEACLSAGNVAFTNKNLKQRNNAKKSQVGLYTLKDPNVCFLASIRRSTRAEYHIAIKCIKKQKEAIRANNMADSLVHNNSCQFWSAVRKIVKVKILFPPM